MNIDHRPATDDRPQGQFTHFAKISNGHNCNASTVNRSHSCFVLGWGFRGRRIERRHFRLDQIQDGGRRPSWKTSNGHISATHYPIHCMYAQCTQTILCPRMEIWNLFHKGEWPIANLRHKEKEWKGISWEIAEKTTREECTLDWSQSKVFLVPILTRSSATAEKQRVSCPHGGRGLGSPAHSPPSRLAYAYGRIRKPQRMYVKRAVHKAHFKMNRAFKVIQGHPYWCRQESRMVCCRNVQLTPTLFLKLTKIRQRENGKFVDFNDLMQVWRRPSKKRLRISTNDVYCQKLEVLAYIFVADSMGSLVFT